MHSTTVKYFSCQKMFSIISLAKLKFKCQVKLDRIFYTSVLMLILHTPCRGERSGKCVEVCVHTHYVWHNGQVTAT